MNIYINVILYVYVRIRHISKLCIHYLGWVAGAYFNLAMFDYPYECEYFEPLPAWPIQVVYIL